VDKEASVADIAPMLGAILGISKTPKGQDKKRAVKPKTKKNGAGHMVTHGEGSVTSQGQQHGELSSASVPTEKHLMRENAKSSLRHATDSWVTGHITTKEHAAVHARAKHILSGKRPMEFKGPSGEKKFKGLR
jgi:hypothetical protein